MKKSMTLLASLLMISGIASAQLPNFTLGIKGGLNVSKLQTDITAEENTTGYNIGLFSRIGGLGLYLQPELYLGTKGGKFTSIGTANGEDKVKFTTLDLPILLGTKIGIPLVNVRFMAGPVISFIVDKDKPVSTAYANVADFNNYKNNTVGLQAGAGVDFSKLTFDVRYEKGLTNVNDSDKYDQKSNLWHISLGIKIL